MAVAALIVFLAAAARAQELEPGTYQNAPTRANIAIASYGYSSGNVLLDREMRKERGIEAGETGHVHRPGGLERRGSWRHAMDIVG